MVRVRAGSGLSRLEWSVWTSLVWLGTSARCTRITRQQQHGGRGQRKRARSIQSRVYLRPYLYSGGHCKGERSSRAGAGDARSRSRPRSAACVRAARLSARQGRATRASEGPPPLLHPHLARISPRAAAGRRLQPCGCGSCYSPAAAAAAACAPSLGAPRMRPVVRVRVRARARARARGRGSDLWSRFGSGSGSGLGLGFGFGFGTGFGFGLATYGLRGLRAAVHRLVAGYHPLSPLLACVRGSDRYTGEGRPRGAISGGPCPLVIIPYARSQHERRGAGGALGLGLG